MKSYAAFVNKHLKVHSRSGPEWQCLCPFHEDTSPSFSVNVRKGLYVCYACGASGKFESLVAHVTGKSSGSYRPDAITARDVQEKVEAIKTLQAGPPPPVLVAPAWLDYWRSGSTYKSMWAERGVTDQAVLDRFTLGYEPIDDALCMPLHDRTGNVTGVVRRFRNPAAGSPKYKYPRGFKISQNLYGWFQVASLQGSGRLPILGVTEGGIDSLRSWQVGVPSVALLGANCSPTQVKLLRALDPVSLLIMTDNDTAGRTAALNLAQKMSGTGIIVQVPSYWPKDCKDLGDMEDSQVEQVVASSHRMR